MYEKFLYRLYDCTQYGMCMNFALYIYFDCNIKLLLFKRIWPSGMLKFNRNTWCNVGEINENDELIF